MLGIRTLTCKLVGHTMQLITVDSGLSEALGSWTEVLFKDTDSEFILPPPATGHKDVALKEYTLK